MRLVIIESPYAGDIETHVKYARRCVKDSLSRGEAPLASHLLYTQDGILDDSDPDERLLGIRAGLAWYGYADACVVYEDYGVTNGMMLGKLEALRFGLKIETRLIGRNPLKWLGLKPRKTP